MRGGEPVTITRKAVETLLVLVESGGQVVLKEELLKTIWPDRVVEEANLTQNIAMVRRALGVERGSAAYIETFPGRGYRLVGPVTFEDATPQITEMSVSATGELKGTHQEQALLPTSLSVGPSFNPPEAQIAATLPMDSFLKWQLWTGALLLMIGLVAGYSLWDRRASNAAPVFRVTALTHLAGLETQPALSPDGQRVAFLWYQEGGKTPQLNVQSTSNAKTLWVSPTQDHYNSPVWSPDANALAFLRITKTATEIVTIPIHNEAAVGTERIVAQFSPPDYGLDNRRLDWSPNGQTLAVSRSEGPEEPYCLYLISLATGEKKLLTKPESKEGGDIAPRFAPGGNSLSFIRRYRRSHQELFTVPLAGGTPQPLTNDDKQISDHDWTGNDIIFASNRSGEFRLWRRATDGSGEPQRLEIFSTFPIKFSIADQVSTLVYSVDEQVRNLWRLDLTTQKWTRIMASTENDTSPQYSPDGKQICFRSNRTGEEQLWLCDAEGANQMQLTHDSLFPSVGTWSPDGRQIVFNNARTREIHIATFNNEKWEVRATKVNGSHPVFSPDGQWIYAGRQQSLIKFPVAGGEPEHVLKNMGGSALRFSTDGKRLFFFKNEQKGNALWQLTLAREEASVALENLLPSCTSCWAPAPEGIYYLGSDQGSFDAQAIYFHRFDAKQPDRLIAKYPEPLSPVGSGPFSLSHDLRYFLCVRMKSSDGDVMRAVPFR